MADVRNTKQGCESGGWHQTDVGQRRSSLYHYAKSALETVGLHDVYTNYHRRSLPENNLTILHTVISRRSSQPERENIGHQ